MSECSKCGGVILADTEEWNKPLCDEHYWDYIEANFTKIKEQNQIMREALEFYAGNNTYKWHEMHDVLLNTEDPYDLDTGGKARETLNKIYE